MSELLINKIAVKLTNDRTVILQAGELPPFWRKTPSNLAYRLRKQTGWIIKGRRDKRTGRIHFERFSSEQTNNK